MKSLYSRLSTPWWIAALSMLVIAGCGSDDDPVRPTTAAVSQVNSVNSSVPRNVFSATLSGSEEAPPVNTAGSGTGLVVIDPTTRAMKATIVTADIAGTQAHIHAGQRGVNGPVVFPLTETGGTGSGIWSTTVNLSNEQLVQLQSGNLYFNVHTAAFPEGEIRGQITATLPQSGGTITTTSTSTGTTSTGATGTSSTTPGEPTAGMGATAGTTAGSAGASGTGGTDATGTNGTTGTTGTTDTPGTAGTTGTELNGGASGAPGTTGTTATGAGTPTATGVAGATTGTVTNAGPATAAAMRPVFFTNVLSGSLVVPATTSTATATAITVYRPRDRSLTSVIVSSGITGTGANIRQATPDAVGPVVTSLREIAPDSGIWAVRTRLSDTQIVALNAGNMYYEILSSAFPNGELRGQIVRTPGATAPAPSTPAGTTTSTGTTTGTSATTGTGTTDTTPAPTTTPTTGMTGTTGSTTGTGTTATTGTTSTPGTGTGMATDTGATTTDTPSATTVTGTSIATPSSTITGTAVATPPSTITGTTTPVMTSGN